tara:strand:+ start:10423 stop:12015 length:1593 start_codon:yes stop_codon:yes gene_type:complete
MNPFKNFVLTISLILITGCGADPDELEDLYIELSASTEIANYDEPFELTWSSNASQCYGSGTIWLGEKPVVGTEEFQIKRGGAYTFILECRRNNEFKNQAVAVSINKTVSNNFIFDVTQEPSLVIDMPQDHKARITAYDRGDYNNDNIGDVFFVTQINNASNLHVDTKFVQVLGGPFPVFQEIDAENCNATGYIKMMDLDQDGISDVIASSRDSNSVKLQGNICTFKGSQTGLVLDNDLVTNETDLDFVYSDVRYLASIDKNIDGVNDIYILTPNGEYWIQRGAENGPAFEKVEYADSFTDSYVITAGTVVDFDSDSNNDILLSAYDQNNQGAFIAVPRSADTTNWDEISIFNINMPIAKIVTSLDYDGDANVDLLIVGDEIPGDEFSPSFTSTFRIYEEGETGIFDNFEDFDFPGKGTISLNKNLFITDFDFDFDGGDFLFNLEGTPNTTDNFLLGVKNFTEVEGEPTVFSIDSVLDGSLDIENFEFENQQMIFVDLDVDFDLDIVVLEEIVNSNSKSITLTLKQNLSN